MEDIILGKGPQMIILSISSAEDQLRQNQGLVMAMDMAMVWDMAAMDIVIVMVIVGDFMVMDFLEVIIGRLTSIQKETASLKSASFSSLDRSRL